MTIMRKTHDSALQVSHGKRRLRSFPLMDCRRMQHIAMVVGMYQTADCIEGMGKERGSDLSDMYYCMIK